MFRWFFIFFLLVLSACSDSGLLDLKRISNGARLYKENCANCHQEEGSGLGKLIPPLRESDYFRLNQSQLPCLIRKGIKEPLTVNGIEYTLAMPSNVHLTDEEIMDICVYTSQKFLDKSLQPSDSLVKLWMGNCN